MIAKFNARSQVDKVDKKIEKNIKNNADIEIVEPEQKLNGKYH